MALDFDKALEPVKKHPVMFGAVILGGALIVFLLLKAQGHASNSTSANTATGPSDQVLIAGEQLQLQGALAQQQNATALASLQIQAQEQGTHDAVAAQLAEAQTAAQLQLGLAQTNAGLQASQTNSANALSIATLSAQVQTQLAALGASTQVTLAGLTAGTELGINKANNDLTAHLADVTSSTAIQQTSLVTNLQNNLAEINANVEQQNISANTAVSLAAIHQKSSSGLFGFLGTLATALLI